MRAPAAPSTPQIRLHPDAAAVEVQALFRGIVIDARCLTGDDAYLVGSAKGVDAPVAEALAGAAHALVSASAAGFTVDLTDQMTGAVIFEDRTTPLAELLRAHGPSFVPPPAARLQIACGDVAFLIGATSAPPTVPRPPLARWRDHWALGFAAVAALVLMVLVAFIPPDPMALSGDDLGKSARSLEHIVIPPAPPPAIGSDGPRGGGAKGGDGKPAAAPKGTRHSSNIARPTRPRGPALVEIGRSGLLGVLTASRGRAWDSVFAPNQALAAGSLEDLQAGDPDGTIGGIGHDPLGTGIGLDRGPLVGGSGPLDIIGKCDAACRGRIAIGELKHNKLPPRQPTQIAVRLEGDGHVRGGLDKDTVRRIIRQHLNEVKYCYEQQLPRHPDLAGRISVAFTIAPNGAVMASLLQSSTVGNLAVESCVVQAVKRWPFPQPQGGGYVMVTYPFVLVPAGSS